ncbi:MAG: carboxypeptidase-like regulatory domain-containing protein, partial [Tannerellaceae bacterium]
MNLKIPKMTKAGISSLCWILLFVLNIASAQANSQQNKSIKVSGTVIDNTSAPLLGVNIVIKGATSGTTMGTVSDLDGNFHIDVPSKNTVLIFKYMGFVTQEVTVGSQTKINIT